ncbi:MAG TPA: GNAT family N-acetyltransferase [Cellvibrio sp.]|nr:GNAT family N-acetyltransferase [Cellvibrio sp.]
MKFIAITENFLQDPLIRKHERVLSVCGSVLDMYKHTRQSSPWLGYLCQIDKQWVGTCAFKGNPQQGRVEIAYFTFPEYEGKGYATAMAARLVAMAKSEDPHIEVFAQTLPVNNASTHILQKLGFKFLKEIVHSEDGLVWEWSSH